MLKALLFSIFVVMCLLCSRHITEYYIQKDQQTHSKPRQPNVSAKQKDNTIYIAKPITEKIGD